MYDWAKCEHHHEDIKAIEGVKRDVLPEAPHGEDKEVDKVSLFGSRSRSRSWSAKLTTNPSIYIHIYICI